MTVSLGMSAGMGLTSEGAGSRSRSLVREYPGSTLGDQPTGRAGPRRLMTCACKDVQEVVTGQDRERKREAFGTDADHLSWASFGEMFVTTRTIRSHSTLWHHVFC